MKTRGMIGILLAALLVVAGVSAAFAQAPGAVRYNPGTYQAEVSGRNGLMKVEVTVDATRDTVGEGHRA